MNWRNRAAMQMKADAAALAYQDYLEALKLAPDDADALAGFVSAAAASNRLDAAESYLRERIARADSPVAEVELSRVLAARGDTKAAAARRSAAPHSIVERTRARAARVRARGRPERRGARAVDDAARANGGDSSDHALRADAPGALA